MPVQSQQEAVQESVQEAQKKRSDELDRAIAAYLASLDWMLDGWTRTIDSLVEQAASLHPASLYQFLRIRLPAGLESFGYTRWAGEVVSSYSDSIDAANVIAATARVPSDHEAIDTHTLATMRNMDFEALFGERDSATGEVIAAIVRGRIGDAPKEQVDDGVKRAVQRLRTNAGRTVDTGILSADRFAIWGKFANLTDHFLYFGPEDSRNRPFCAAHVGKTYTVKAIRMMDNGTGYPVSTSCGGPRCRHTLVPQLDSGR